MSSYTKEKLEYLQATKDLIREAIVAKGQEVSDNDTFRSYADKILAIEGGGSSGSNDVFPEQTLTFGELGVGMTVMNAVEVSPAQFIPVVGESYKVVWDGKEYDCTAADGSAFYEGGVAVGNMGIVGATDTQEPFLIAYLPDIDSNLFIAADEETAHKVRIYQVADMVDAETAAYNLALAETMMTRNAEYLGDEKTLNLKKFITSDGRTLASLTAYSFAGFSKVEYMVFSDLVWINEDSLRDCTALKILDVTATSDLNMFGVFPGGLNGCTALESVIVRDGGAGLSAVTFSKSADGEGTGGNDTFFVYVPSAYYDTIIANVNSNANAAVPASRYRKLEDYPEVDRWAETYTVEFYDGDTLVGSKIVRYGQSATMSCTKTGYKLIGWNPQPVNVTTNMKCYAQFAPENFATATWADIAKVAESGMAASAFNLGDTKTISVTFVNSSSASKTVDLEMEIVGFNHDDLADGSGKAGITLVSKDAVYFAELYEYTSSGLLNINMNNGWENSKIRTHLNENTFSHLPTEVSAHIKAVTKTTRASYTGYTLATTTDMLFIPTQTEYTGDKQIGQCGVQYERFTDSQNRRKYHIGYNGRGSAYDKHFVAYPSYNKGYLSYINESGTLVTNGTHNQYAAFGFCI